MAKCASTSPVDKYFQELKHVIKIHSFANDPHLIYNVDEKGFTQNHTAPMAGVVVRLQQVDC